MPKNTKTNGASMMAYSIRERSTVAAGVASKATLFACSLCIAGSAVDSAATRSCVGAAVGCTTRTNVRGLVPTAVAGSVRSLVTTDSICRTVRDRLLISFSSTAAAAMRPCDGCELHWTNISSCAIDVRRGRHEAYHEDACTGHGDASGEDRANRRVRDRTPSAITRGHRCACIPHVHSFRSDLATRHATGSGVRLRNANNRSGAALQAQ